MQGWRYYFGLYIILSRDVPLLKSDFFSRLEFLVDHPTKLLLEQPKVVFALSNSELL